MSTPKRHHFVPRAYLDRFGENGTVRVRRRDRSATFVTNTLNVAVRCGFYDHPDGPENERGELERELARLDDAAAEAMRVIDREGVVPRLGSQERLTLAIVMAQQLTRTPELRERALFPLRIAEYADGREIDRPLVEKYLRDVHLGFQPRPQEVEAAHDFVTFSLRDEHDFHDFALRSMFTSLDELAPRLLTRRWTLEVARKPRFITSDLPLVMWRPPTPRDNFEGVGLENSDEVRFPLDPGKQLVLRPEGPDTEVVEVEPGRVRACNQDVAAGCHEFVVGHPRRGLQLDKLELAPRRPVLRLNSGPLYVTGPDGETIREGDALHMWVPRR
jgi:hypothetical protein